MTDTDQEKEDEVLRRMLKTPHKPQVSKLQKAQKELTKRSRLDSKNQDGSR